MAKILGTSGVIKSGAVAVANVVEFSLEESTEVVDVSALGQTAKEFMTDRTAWAGSMTVQYDKDDAGQDTLLNGASLTGHFIPAGSTAGNEDWSGTILITGISMPVAAGTVVTRQISFQGSLALGVSAVV